MPQDIYDSDPITHDMTLTRQHKKHQSPSVIGFFVPIILMFWAYIVAFNLMKMWYRLHLKMISSDRNIWGYETIYSLKKLDILTGEFVGQHLCWDFMNWMVATITWIQSVLNFSWIKFWFVTILHKYFKFSIFKGLFIIFMLRFCPAFWEQHMLIFCVYIQYNLLPSVSYGLNDPFSKSVYFLTYLRYM
jgi:hypothetical protein